MSKGDNTKKNSFSKRSLFLLFILFSFLILVIYRDVYQAYFQADEWYFSGKLHPVIFGPNPISDTLKTSLTNLIVSSVHALPVADLIILAKIRIVGLNYPAQISINLFFHIINSLLITILLLRLSKRKNLAIIGGLFFALAEVGWQAPTWVSALASVLAVTFSLITVLFFQDYIEKKKSQVLYLIFFFLALFEKETSIVLIAVLPFLGYLKFGLNKTLFYKLKGFIIFSSIFLFIRFFLSFISRIILPKEYVPQLTTSSVPATLPINIPLMLFQSITYPLKMLPELFVPRRIVENFIAFITPYSYPTYAAEQKIGGINYLQYLQTVGSDMIVYLLSLLLIVGIVFIYFYKKNNLRRNLIKLSIIIILFTSFPLILLGLWDPFWTYISFFDQRHLYMPTIAGSILVVVFILFFEDLIKTFGPVKRNYMKLIGIFLFIAFFVIQISNIKHDMTFLTSVTGNREEILSMMAKKYSPSKNKNIFFVQSNTAYYGMADTILPFQVSSGYTFLTYLAYNSKLPEGLLTSDFLMKKSFTSEGYLESEGMGFGYYQKMDTLLRDLEKGKFSISDVNAFSWNGTTLKLTNNTEEVRKKVEESQKELAVYRDWDKVYMDDLNFSFRVPPDAVVTEQKDTDKTVLKSMNISYDSNIINVKVRKKIFNIGLFEDVSLLKDSNGNEINDNFYMREIKMKKGDTVLAKTTTQGPSMKYFIPIVLPNTIVEVTVENVPSELNKAFPLAEEIISFMRYPEDSN